MQSLYNDDSEPEDSNRPSHQPVMDPDPLFADNGEDFNWLEVDRAPPESDESEGEPLGDSVAAHALSDPIPVVLSPPTHPSGFKTTATTAMDIKYFFIRGRAKGAELSNVVLDDGTVIERPVKTTCKLCRYVG